MSWRLSALVLAIVTMWLAGAAAASAQVGDRAETEHLRLRLIAQTETAAAGSTVLVGLEQRIAEGWHTYWINPGDTGAATVLTWTLPAGVELGEAVWPVPERILTEVSGLRFMNYGYAERALTVVPVQLPATARPGEVLRLALEATFFVCSDELCIPETARLALDLRIGPSDARPDPATAGLLRQAIDRAPRDEGLLATTGVTGGVVRLSVTGAALAGSEMDGAYFFPDRPGVIVHSAVQRVERGRAGLTLTIPAAEGVTAESLAGEGVSGLLATPAGAWRVTARPGPAPDGSQGLGVAAPAPPEGRPGPDPTGGLSLWQALGFAVLGGLILNIMPCVFPVLAMKAASLARVAAEPRQARMDGLAFGLGVLATFAVMAVALLVLRAGGQALGWGFQLQSPLASALLALLMLAVALNLAGLFEAGRTVQGLGSRLAPGAGAFSTGVVAVLVAAPCTAPFMAAALGFALVQPWWIALAVVLALGVGFALPFVVLALSPGLLRRLPRPGPWMMRARGLLSVPMFAAAAWLGWVFLRQTGPEALAWLVAAGLVMALGLALMGRRQQAEGQGWQRVPGRLVPLAAGVVALGLVGVALMAPRPVAAPDASALPSRPWSEAAVAAARAQGQVVVVNFTADWCLTCKVNEAAALSSDRIAAAFAEQGVTYLVADWTRRDADIARALAGHGRSGVPLYLVYGPEGPAEALPQILTEGAVLAAVERARAGPEPVQPPQPEPSA